MADPKISQLNEHSPQPSGNSTTRLVSVMADSGEPVRETQFASQVTETLLQLAQTNKEFLAHASFTDSGDNHWSQICTVWDSASNTCLIRPHLVAQHWTWVTRSKRVVTGVGGKQTECLGIVQVPIKCTYNGKVHIVCASVIDFHQRIDFMYGLDFQNSERTLFDPANYRVYVGTTKETVRLDTLSKVKDRLRSDPIVILSICGGCDPALGMALMMGFRISHYFSIEKYEHTRAVAKGCYPMIEHVSPHDLLSIDTEALARRIAGLNKKVIPISGCPCTPWSRLSDNPLGFEHPLAELVRKTASLVAELNRHGVLWKALHETVVC